LSFLRAKNNQFNQTIYGLNAVHSFAKNWIIRTEVDLEKKKLIVNNAYKKKVDGLYSDHQVGHQLFKGGLAYIIYEYAQADLSNNLTQIYSPGIGLQFLPVPHVEFQLEYQRRTYRSQSGNPEHRSFFTFHLYH
jgi:hypothetical protein